MWIIPVLFLIAELACVVRVRASEPSMWGTSTTQPVPEGAAVALVFDRQEYFLGENILVHFVIENTGGVPFSSHWGGDSRGSSRPLRFKVTATDETGRVAEDPDPFPMCFGGFGGQHTLKPGEKFITTLALMRYCQIDKPGVYTIRATHDFGWKEGERKRPVGEAKITLRMPDATQAEGVVAQMEQLPEQTQCDVRPTRERLRGLWMSAPTGLPRAASAPSAGGQSPRPLADWPASRPRRRRKR